MENIKVPCLSCKGNGEHWISNPEPSGGDPGRMSRVPCATCNGFGILIATELKRIEKWEPVSLAQKG